MSEHPPESTKEEPTRELEEELTPEQKEEVIDKLVDMLSTRDLKYRNINTLTDELEKSLSEGVVPGRDIGIRGNLTSVSMSMRDKLREVEQEIVKERSTSRHKMHEEDSTMRDIMGTHRQSGNVFYPEGMINISRAILTDSSYEVFEGDLKDIKDTYLITSLYGRSILSVPRVLLEGLEPGDLNLSQEDRSFLDDLFKRVWGGSWPQGGSLSRADLLMERITDFDRSRLVDLLSNPEIWESIRLKWLELFFSNARRTQRFAKDGSMDPIVLEKENVPDAELGIHSSHNLYFGLILSPKLKVFPSEHDDYPAQGTIMAHRASPKRDIIGLYVDIEEGEHRSLVSTKEAISEAKKYKLPLYDLSGNLLWPENISHQDVAKIVARREGDKNENE